MKRENASKRKTERRAESRCITCEDVLEPDYGERFRCLDCAWWAELAARRQAGEKRS